MGGTCRMHKGREMNIGPVTEGWIPLEVLGIGGLRSCGLD